MSNFRMQSHNSSRNPSILLKEHLRCVFSLHTEFSARIARYLSKYMALGDKYATNLNVQSVPANIFSLQLAGRQLSRVFYKNLETRIILWKISKIIYLRPDFSSEFCRGFTGETHP